MTKEQFSGSRLAPKASPAMLKVASAGITDGCPIDPKFAYCRPDGKGQTTDGGNINPQISWSTGPSGTKSYALIEVDTDVPATFELANQEGKSIPADFPRQDFYHWVLVDIPPNVTEIPEGKASHGKTPGGKPLGPTVYGLNGKNDYGRFSKGSCGGYDGCCPPWNDERMHHYHFIVCALDVPTLGLSGDFDGRAAMAAMQGHVLARGEIVGTYTNNPKLLAR